MSGIIDAIAARVQVKLSFTIGACCDTTAVNTERIAAHGNGIVIETDRTLGVKSVKMIPTAVVRKVCVSNDKPVIHAYP